MAITHDDLSVRRFRTTDISGKLALFLVIFSVLCGLAAFILCLSAEGARSEVTWLFMTSQDGYKGYRCYYNRSGRVPLASAVAAFLVLAVAMFAEHAYMLVAVTSPQLPVPGAWPALRDPRLTPSTRDLTWQVCCLFLTTWLCFALAEILLLIGIGVESGHLSNWTTQRSNCRAIRPGAFAVAGVFGLITVFLGVGLYLTALRTVRLHVEEAKGRRAGIPGASDQYPQLPPSHMYPHLPPTAPRVPPPAAAGAQHGQQQLRHAPEKISTSA
ncbi:uncharacterized protein M6B38_148810 [Iris pallida]|uniref:Uncharacterized protein n=1 Tax=Iris pallida TaxID=29817 RepID=A0AAX6F8S8_IRIPA|nr:uncharacterized protein M6B38_148810 [Iris pallida]